MTKNKKRLLIVLVIILTAGITALGVVSRGFRDWNYKQWFKGSAAKVVTVEAQPIEQRVMALTSSDNNDIDYTFVHDSEETVTTFAVSRAAAPIVCIEYPSNTLLSSTASCGTRVSISVKDPHVGVVYTSGTVNIWVYAHVISGPPVSLGQYTFTVTSENQTYYLEADELDILFQKAKTNNYNAIQISAQLTGVAGYSNSLSSSNYIVYDLSNHDVDFEYSGSIVTIPLNADLLAKNAYSVYVETKGTTTDTVACKNLYNSSQNKGTAISVEDNSFVIDLSKVSFWNNTSANQTYIRLTVSTQALGVNAFYGTSWLYSYFEISKLPAPTNLTYNAGTLTWDAVAAANRYGVFWTDSDGIEQHIVVTEPTYTFDLNELGEGDYTVRVRALGNIGEHIADGEISTMRLTAYNASTTVTQLVALTYSVNGENIVKFVPYGKNVVDYCYTVSIPNKEFGGWYYDSGYSRKVEKSDVLSGDTTIYARLSDKKVTERKLTWWEQHRWQVFGPIIAFVTVGIIVGVVVGIRKKKAA